MKTLVDLFERSAERYEDRPAVVADGAAGSEVWSYRQLLTAANAAAHALTAGYRVAAGQRILVCAENSPRLVALYLAAMRARVVLVPLDPQSPPDFIERVASDTGAALLVHSGSMPDLPEIRKVGLATIPFARTATPPSERPVADDVVEIVFTSGPKGRPRGVMLTHENILANVLSTSEIVDHDRHWRVLSVLPMSHMLEQTVGLYVPLYLGSTVYYGAGLKPTQLRKAMQRHRITSVVLVPKLLDLLLQGLEREVRRHGEWSRWRLLNQMSAYLPLWLRRVLFRSVHQQMGGAFAFFISGGAHLDTELWRKWEHIGIPVIQGYGATECAPVIASNTQHRRVAGSVGRALSGIEIRLGESAELQVRGRNVSIGYWQDHRSDRQAFTEDGWYRTGDLATIDGQGNVFLRGHLNDTIVLSSGVNIFPQDLEAVLEAEDAVRSAVVLAVDVPPAETKITAAVVLDTSRVDAASHEHLAESAVRAANARLGPYQRITDARIWQGADFPRTQFGTVDRRVVREVLTGNARPQLAAGEGGASPDAGLDIIRQLVSEIGGADPSELRADTLLNEDIGFTSLSQVELAVSLEKAFGIELDDEQFAAIRCLGDLLELVERGGAVCSAPSYRKWPLHQTAIRIRSLLQKVLMFNLHRLLVHPFEVMGAENLRMTKPPVLFIANHSSHIDTLSIIRALPSAIRRRTAVAAAADYFFRTRVIGSATSLLLNTFPFSRGAQVRRSLEYCAELARTGWSILIYPEGTRSTTGELLPFKGGIGLLAEELRVPIVPIAVYGGFEILPKGRRMPRPGPARVLFGEPISPDRVVPTQQLVANLQRSLAELINRGRGGDGR